MMKRILFFSLLVLAMCGSSCKKEESLSQQEQLAIDDQKIRDYLTAHNLEAQKTASGLYYIISDAGTGANPNINSTVTVQYNGTFLDGSSFDANTATFPLANVIVGWQEGIPLFKLKGRGKLIIPSYLGYGPSGSGSVPANSVLVFDIYLISFN